MWTVVVLMEGQIPYYALKNTKTGEIRGHFDCEPWASYQAKLMNKAGLTE